MTNEQINQLREIIANAPSGATGFSECGVYLSRSVMAREELFFGMVNKEWMPVPRPNKFERRGFEDIKQIIADHDEKHRLRELLEGVLEIQDKYYGDGMGLHIAMINVSKDIKDALTND